MASINEKTSGSDNILHTPVWVMVIRGFQLFLSLVILGLAGRLMHDAYLDEEGLALAISLFTWFIIAYIVLTEKIPSLHKAYNIIAVLVLDGLMVILWLATFAAVAAKRARFIVDVSVSSCSDNGSLIDSKTCSRKRGVLLFKSGMAMMSAIAGLGALVWLLFVAVFVWSLVMFFRGRKEGRFLFSASSDNYQLEAKPVPQSEPLMDQPTAYAPQAPYPPQGDYSVQGQAAHQQPQHPYPPQDGAYQQPQGTHYPPQEQQQSYAYPPQEPYSAGGYQSPPPQHQGSELVGSGGYHNSTSPPPPHQNYQ